MNKKNVCKIISIKYKVVDLLLINIILVNYLSKILEYNRHKINNSLEDDLKNYFCNILIFEKNFNCFDEIFDNINFFDDVKSTRKNINLLITEKETKIENLFLLIAAIPFIEKDSKLIYKINERKFHSIFQFQFFFGNIINDNIIMIKKPDAKKLGIKLINLLEYKWELIPSRNILNIIRYVINHYYEESCLITFEKLLNINFKNYIKVNHNILAQENECDLFSKK